MSDSQSQNPGLLANILAVAGFIILIVIIVWGAYHLLRLTGSGISSLFSRFGGNAITVTVPTPSAQSGKQFTLSWKYEPRETGSYALLYQCKAGFRLETVPATGKGASIPCGNAFSIGSTTNIPLLPVLNGTTSLDVPLSIVFLPSATTSKERPQGTATLKVTAASGTTNTLATGTAPSTPSTTPKPAGAPDLSVRILAVGVINPMTNLFEYRTPASPEDIAAVQFDIANDGSASTGTYYFTVQLPIQGGQAYASPAQSSLTPGSHVVNTLRFKPVTPGGGTVTVLIDPSNNVKESHEGNNAASMYVSAPTWSGYYSPYVY